MIEKISLKNVASYDSIDGVQLNDLKKLNFFFGFNGSGKSTIAKFFYNLSLSDSEKSTDFNNCFQNGFNPSSEQILVFDENFTEINFNKNSFLKGVFSLNQKNGIIDIQIKGQEKLIESNKKKQEKKNILKKTIEIDKDKNENALLEYCWSQRNKFSTFSKISLAYPKSKPNHLNNIKNVLQKPLGTIPTIQSLIEEYRQLYEKDLSEVKSLISRDLYKQIRNIENELNILLNEIIVGNEDIDISALIKTLNSRNWIEKGVEFLKQTGNICPFCQKETIDDNLKGQFNELFDETYKKKIEHLTNLFTLYKEKTLSFAENISVIQNSYNQDNITSNLYIKLKELFDSNYLKIDSKKKTQMSEKVLSQYLP